VAKSRKSFIYYQALWSKAPAVVAANPRTATENNMMMFGKFVVSALLKCFLSKILLLYEKKDMFFVFCVCFIFFIFYFLFL
jgi:hypothetical protein